MTLVLQGITQFYLPANTTYTCLYSQMQSITTLWLVLIAAVAYPCRDGQAEFTWVYT